MRQIQACETSRRPLPTQVSRCSLLHWKCFIYIVLSVPSGTDLPTTSAQAKKLLTLNPLLLRLSLFNSHVVFHPTSQVTFSGRWPYICLPPSHPGAHVISFSGSLNFPWSTYQGFLHTSVCVLIKVYFSH